MIKWPNLVKLEDSITYHPSLYPGELLNIIFTSVNTDWSELLKLPIFYDYNNPSDKRKARAMTLQCHEKFIKKWKFSLFIRLT